MKTTYPEVKKYLNVFQFLQDCYQFRKNNTAEFSYETWADEIDVNDKSYLRMMVIGKRPLNLKMTDAFSKNLNLTGDEKTYFEILVQYTQSKTREHKELLGQKLISLLKNELDQIEIKSHFDFLSNPLLPRLQVILSFDDIDQSVKNLAWLLGSSESEILNALTTLINFKLIEKNGDRLIPAKKSFKVPDQFGDLGLEAFYHKNLDDAKSAIQLPKDERRYKTLMLPMNQIEFNEYLQSLQNFTTELLAKHNYENYENRRLYQVHFNLFPVSQPQIDNTATSQCSEV